MSKRAVAEETDRDLTGLQTFCGKGGARRDSSAAADDGIGSEVSRIRIRDVHRSAFSFAVAGFFPEQLSKHFVERRSFGETVSVAPMSTRDVIVWLERFTDTNGNRFLTYIKVGEAGHERAGIEVINLLFEEPDHDHAPIHMKPLLGFNFRLSLRPIYSGCHFETPDI